MSRRAGFSQPSRTAIAVTTFLAAVLLKTFAGTVLTKPEIFSQLASAAIVEDFESYTFPTNTAERIGPGLDASSVIKTQGPGLVRAGIRFSAPDADTPSLGGLQWDRQFQYGLESAAMVTDGRLILDFSNSVTHVGFDIFWFDVGFPLGQPATIQIFRADKVSLLYSTNIFEPFAPNSYFIGLRDPAGIGRVVLFRDEDPFGVSPIIDNLIFGTVPFLSISLINHQARLSWPDFAAGFQLQCTTNSAASDHWITVTNVPVLLNNLKTVDLSVDSTKFFRLYRQ